MTGMADDLPKEKLLGRLRQIWSKLSDGESYLIPESVDDIKALGFFPFFQINRNLIYAKDTTKEALYDFVEELHPFCGRNICSSSTLLDATKDQIKEYFSSEERKPFEWHLARIVSSVRSQDKRRFFIKGLNGLELVDLTEVQVGSWRLVDFTEAEAKSLLDKISGDQSWKEHISQLFTGEFIRRRCLLIAARGDCDQARVNADRIARFVINTFRYGICIHIAHTARVHEYGIDSAHRPPTWGLNYFQYELESGEANLGKGSQHRLSYKLTAANLQIMKEEWHFEELWSLIEKETLTDVEASIVEAVNWLGDAQQDESNHIAFLKYWIALEALITGYEKNKVTTRLQTAIPILLSSGPKNVPTPAEVERMYDLRSGIIHGGKTPSVRRSDVNKLCTWAYGCIAVYINFRKLGYTTREQIYKQAQRIYSLKSGGKGTKSLRSG